jgi:hypothetical protein
LDTKICTSCKAAKDLSEFYSYFGKREGKTQVEPICKVCHLARDRRDSKRPHLKQPEDLDFKICTLCLCEKPKTEFYARNARCKPCKLKADTARYVRKREPLPVSPNENSKVCIDCRLPKVLNDFYSFSSTRYGGVRKHAKCKECQRAYVKAGTAYHERNKERIRKRNLVRYEATGGRANQYPKTERPDGRKIAQAAVVECLELYRIGDQYWDVYDSRLIDSPTIDHIVPVTAGGTHTADNFCVTSLENNASKGNRSLLVWLAKRAR